MLESYVTKTRDKAGALQFMHKVLKRHDRAEASVTDALGSYPADMRELGSEHRREMGRHANTRAESPICLFDDGSAPCNVSGR